MAFPPWGSSDHVVVSVSIDFPSHSQQDVLFHRIVYDYSCADWDGLHVPWDYIFKLSASAAASEFCEWLQVGINVYIPHWKCQVKPHSSPWFSAAHAATIVHRNHFFVCTKRINLLNLRQSSNRLVIVAKGFLKQKSPSLSRNVAFRTFGELPIVLSRKVNLPYPPINDSEVLPSASDKAKLFAENFSKNSTLDDSGISLPVFPSRTNFKLHNICVSPNMFKKVIMNLNLPKASGPDCIPVVVLKNCEPELSYILSELFNKCLKESCFPYCWKVSLVVPAIKNVGERSTAKNYCPVSLLSVVSKVLQ